VPCAAAMRTVGVKREGCWWSRDAIQLLTGMKVNQIRAVVLGKNA